MSTGRINATMSDADVEQVLALLAQLGQQLPFLQRLTTDDKTRMVKPRPGIGDVVQTIVGLERDLGMGRGDDDPMLADFSVYTRLTIVADHMTSLLQRIEDSKTLAGSECWNESLIRYGTLRQLERRHPEIKTRLDRIRPLITSRSNRPAPAPGGDEPGDEPAE